MWQNNVEGLARPYVYPFPLFGSILKFNYHFYPTYWDRQACAVSVDPDQMQENAASGQAYTVELQ